MKKHKITDESNLQPPLLLSWDILGTKVKFEIPLARVPRILREIEIANINLFLIGVILGLIVALALVIVIIIMLAKVLLS